MEIGYRQQVDKRRSILQNPFFGWSILTISAVIWCFLLLAAPLARANSYRLTAVTLYTAFSKICHQLPGRSFYLAGYPFAVCSRCTGLYVGFTAILLLYPLVRSLRVTEAPPRKWLFWAALPMAIDVAAQFLGVWHNTHTSRFFTGALLGSVTVFYVVPGWLDLVARIGSSSLVRKGQVSAA
jgi:uncharacterized membrane protein